MAMVASVLVLASLLTPVSARGSDREKPKPYALIFGTVWGPDGHPLYGVKVKIRRADEKKARWELYSNHTGEFAQRLPVGKADYIVWAEVKGYKAPSGRRMKACPQGNSHIQHERTSVHRAPCNL